MCVYVCNCFAKINKKNLSVEELKKKTNKNTKKQDPGKRKNQLFYCFVKEKEKFDL